MFGIAFGLGLGTLAGVSVGPYIFPRVTKPKDYSLDLGAKADANEDNEQERHQGAIGAEMRNLLQYTEPWTFWPDYQRVAMSNRIVEVMWPTIKVAALKEAFRQMKPILESTVFKPFPFIENIVLGTDSMRDDFPDFSKWIKDREFGVGDFPFRLGGIKAYVTSEDEVVLELPMVWGSNCKFDVGVFLRFWKFRIYVPCTIENLQFKAEARVTLRPLVDTVPCVGGVMISLLSVPHFDLSFKLGGRVDLMALPIIKETIKNVTKMVLDGMLVYPNHMSFPIMKDYGIPPPAKGALNVKLLYAEGFESTKKLYVRFDVRKSRPVFSTAQRVDVPTGKVEWGQEFNLIVDDYIQQRLKISLFADDLGWSDTLLADGELLFGTQVEEDDPDTGEPVLVDNLAEFIKAPLTEVAAEVRLWGLERQGAFAAVGGGAKSMVKGVGSMGRSLAASFKGNAGEVDAKEAHKRAAEATAAALAARQRKELGSVYIKVTFLPFFQPTFDDEEDEEELTPEQLRKKSNAAAVRLPSTRAVNFKIHDGLKGVLTVKLIRGIDLKGEDLNSYVRLTVSNDEDPDQMQKSAIVFAQTSPRWNQVFDFVMVRANSLLHLTVHARSSFTSNVLGAVNVFSAKKSEEEKDKIIGKLTLPVRDVVRNSHLKDIWTLQDTERGKIELDLQWQTCFITEA